MIPSVSEADNLPPLLIVGDACELLLGRVMRGKPTRVNVLLAAFVPNQHREDFLHLLR
jgi:hypothetical protein